MQREVLVRPDLGKVERIVGHLVGLLVRHHLDEHLPLGAVAVLDVLHDEEDKVYQHSRRRLPHWASTYFPRSLPVSTPIAPLNPLRRTFALKGE